MSEDTVSKQPLKLTIELVDDDDDEHDIIATCVEVPGVTGRGKTILDAFTSLLFNMEWRR
jgi:hypothetical protein